jgi:ubiquinone/menaquinone biosynthesis C-methylase UbiE
MSLKEACCVLKLYPSLSLRDKLIILARLTFCVRPIMKVLEQHLPEHGLVLDLGCGYGVISHLVSIGCPDRKVIGIDMSSRRVDAAKRSTDHRENIEFQTADIREVQIPRCNAIMMIDILSMLPCRDQERILTQCYEMLCSSGVLVIKDTTKSPYWKYIYAYIEDVIKTKLGVYGREIREHSSRYWDVQEFLDLLDRIGFHATAIPLKSRLPYPGVFYVCQKQ